MKRIKKKWIVWGIVLLALFALILRGCGGTRRAGYTSENAETRNIETFYSFSGNIDAKNKQNVTASSTAAIKEIYVSEGDYVRKGDVLIAFDDDDIASQIASAQASVELARINYEKAQGPSSLTTAETAFNDAQINLERTLALYQAGAVSQSQLEQAQTQYSNTKAQLEIAETNYSSGIQSSKAQYDQANANLQNALTMQKNRRIEAKVDGVVADVYVLENSTLTAGQKILDVIDYSSLILSINVDEYELDAITIGKEALVHVNALNKDVYGMITKISNQAKKTGDLSYFTAEIELEQSEDLRVGLSVETKIQRLAKYGVVTISMEALQFDVTNKPFVYVGAPARPTQKFIEIGVNDGLIVEVTGGLNSGDIVLVPNALGTQAGPPQGAVQVNRQVTEREAAQE